jgi:hypothetical protein
LFSQRQVTDLGMPNLSLRQRVRLVHCVGHAGHLYALWEGGRPHEINPDTLETVGVRRFGGLLRWMGSYSAHPSFCPRSGDTFNFGVEFIPRPHLRIYRTNPRGTLEYFRSAPLPYVAMGARLRAHRALPGVPDYPRRPSRRFGTQTARPLVGKGAGIPSANHQN